MDIGVEFAEIASRGQGLSIEFRRSGTNWPKPWRLTLYSSKKTKTVEYFDSYDSLQMHIINLI